MTTATVKVGYEYEDCDTVWSIETTQLAGHDMTSSDLNGWNIDVQHKYNYHAGILQKGDGTTVYLKYKPQVRTTVTTAVLFLLLSKIYCSGAKRKGTGNC